VKRRNFRVSCFPRSLVRCGGKIKYILIAYFLGNICAKNCRNWTVYVKIIASCKGGTFFETRCTTRKAIECATTLPLTFFYIMKVCSRLFVLYCRSGPKDDKSRHFDPHFEVVKGGVEPWWMARWKACVEFLLSVIELLFLSLTVEALQGKMCQNSLFSVVGRSLGAKISGGRVVPGKYLLVSTKLDTFCYLNVQTAPWQNTGVWRTDRRTDGRNCRS